MHGGDRHHLRVLRRQHDHAVVAGADLVELALQCLVRPAEPHRAEPGQLDAGSLGLGLVGQKRLLPVMRSEEHTSELQSLMRTSYAVFCLKKKKTQQMTIR